MCGISALILADSNGVACPDLFESLGLLQHRGQVMFFFVFFCWESLSGSRLKASLNRMLLVLSLALPRVDSTNVKEMVW